MMNVLGDGLFVNIDVSLNGPSARPEAELVLGALDETAYMLRLLLTIADT